MIWILATRGAGTKLRAAPFTETAIEGVHSVVYKIGVEPVPFAGDNQSAEPLGTYGRGLQRIFGVVFSFHGSVAEELFGISAGIDLVVRYRANGQARKRTFGEVIFVGDATVTAQSLNTGRPRLIGVPFRVQIRSDETLAEHVTDAAD